jgi:hypothetical protein
MRNKPDLKYQTLIILAFLSWGIGFTWLLWEFSGWILGFGFNPWSIIVVIAGFVFMGVGFKFLDKDKKDSDE